MIRHNIDFEKKDRTWALDTVRYIWENKDVLCCDYYLNRRSQIREVNDYSLGRQSISRYKKLFSKESEGVVSQISKVTHRPLTIYKTFRRIALEKLSNRIKFTTVLEPIDAQSITEQDEELKKIEAKILLEEELKKIEPALAQSIDSIRGSDEPKDKSAFDIYKQFTYKHSLAAQMEQAIGYYEYVIGVDDISYELLTMLYDHGVGACKVEMLHDGKVAGRACHIENMLVGYSSKRDYSTAQFIGEILYFSPEEIISNPDFNVSEDEAMALRKAAKLSSGSYTSDTVRVGGCEINIKALDAGLVPVLNLELRTPINKRFRVRTTSIGDNVDVRPTNKSDRRDDVETLRIDTIYEIYWVVGSNIILKNGQLPNQRRKDMGLRAEYSFKIFAPHFDDGIPSGIGIDAIPVIDFIQLNWLNLLSSLAQAVPSGYGFNIDALEDVDLTLDGEDLTPQSLISLFFEKGSIFYRRKGLTNEPEHTVPVEKLINGVGQEVMVYAQNVTNGIELLRKITGMNEVTDGSSPNPKLLTTPALLAAEASNNSTGFVVKGVEKLRNSIANSLYYFVRYNVKRGKELKLLNRAIGEDSVSIIKLGSDFSMREFGIIVEQALSELEKDKFLEYAVALANAGEMDFRDVIVIEMAKTAKEAYALISYSIEKRRKEKQEIAMLNSAAQSKGQQEVVMTKAQMEMEKMKLQAQLKLEQIKLEKDLELRNKQQITAMENAPKMAKIEADLELKQ